MTLSELKNLLYKDKQRWNQELGKNKINFFLLFLFLREYRIVVRLRLCEYLRSKKPLFLIYCIERFLYRRVTLRNGCDIPSRTKIGAGFVIHHCTGIVINPNAIIGKNCTIRGGAVIGSANKGVPSLGDNVNIGVHAIIIGNVHIGNGCVIGAGAVVTKSTEPNGVYAGIPARKIKERS